MLKEIGLHAQWIVLIILSSIHRHLYDYVVRMGIFTLIMNKIFIRALKFMRQTGYGHDLELQITLQFFYVSYLQEAMAARKVIMQHTSTLEFANIGEAFAQDL